MSTPLRSRRSAAAAAEAAIAASAASPFPRSPSSNNLNLNLNLGRRSTLRKQVSYVEVPVGVDDPEPEVEGELGSDVDDTSGAEEEEPAAEKKNGKATPPAVDVNEDDDAPESGPGEGSPAPAKRGRGGFRGRRPRGRKRGSGMLSSRTKMPTLDDDDDDPPGSPMDVMQEDEDGNSYARHKVRDVYYDVVNDEVEMEDDPEGDKKIDSKGRLLGGREYKILTFTSDERSDPERLYVLGIECARTCGYRETGDMVRKCPLLVKLLMTPKEKERATMLQQGKRGLKFNHMMMFAARNVFKYHGAKVVKDGKWVNDHYYEKVAAEDCEALGHSPGDLVGDFRYQPASNDLHRSIMGGERTVGAPFYTSSGPTTHWGGNGQDPWTESGFGNKRAKLISQGVNPDNWMWKMALSAREYEREMTRERAGWLQSMLPTERLTVYQEQHDPVEDDGASGEASRKEDPPYIIPSANSLDGLFPKDADGRLMTAVSLDAEAIGDDANSYNEKILESLRKGTVEIEDEETTIAGRPFITKVLKAGQPRGVYEPHTNLMHVPRNLQSTASTLERISPLPDLSTPEKPYSLAPTGTGHGTFSATMSGRKVGHYASALSSWEYVYDGEGEAGRKRKRQEEVRRKMDLVREAEEWEAEGEED